MSQSILWGLVWAPTGANLRCLVYYDSETLPRSLSEMKQKKVTPKIVDKVAKDAVKAELKPRYQASVSNELTPAGYKYLLCAADPKNAPAARPPVPYGGFTRRSAVIKTKAVIDVAVSSASGVGYALIVPSVAGPTTDCLCAYYSNAATFAGTAASSLSLGGVGTGAAYWAEGAPFTGASAQSAYAAQWRTVACCAYITPTAGVNTQTGTITMLESAGHALPMSTTFNAIIGNRNARSVRAVQTGDPAVQNALNWHPCSTGQYQAGSNVSGSNAIDDFYFRNLPQAANGTTITNPELVIVFTGAAGATYRVEIICVYEALGANVAGLKRCKFSSNDMDLIMEAFNAKNQSGWVGKPNQAAKSYETAVVHVAEDNKHPEERKLPAKEDRNALIPWWKDAVSIAKDVAGFLL